MDTYLFLKNVVVEEIRSLRLEIEPPTIHDDLIFNFARTAIDSIERAAGDLEEDVDLEDSEQVEAACNLQADIARACAILRLMIRHLSRAGDQPVALGIVHLVQQTLADLDLSIQALPELTFYLDAVKGYSIVLLSSYSRSFWNILGGVSGVDQIQTNEMDAIILGLPSGNPSNALLTPILAHEIGHLVVDLELEKQLETSFEVVERVIGLHEAGDSVVAIGPRASSSVIYSWLTELVSDILACLIVGPAYVFSAMVYLRAPHSGDRSNTHPPTPVRIALCLRVLNSQGWSGVLEGRASHILTELTRISASYRVKTHDEKVLHSVMEEVEAELVRLAKGSVPKALMPAEYTHADKLHELEQSIRLRLVPSHLAENPPSLWTVINAAWFSELAELDNFSAVPILSADREFNEFTAKTLELAGISTLWRSIVDTSA